MNREQTEEVKEFIKLLKMLDQKQQEGLYLIIKGAAALCTEKKSVLE